MRRAHKLHQPYKLCVWKVGNNRTRGAGAWDDEARESQHDRDNKGFVNGCNRLNINIGDVVNKFSDRDGNHLKQHNSDQIANEVGHFSGSVSLNTLSNLV